MLKEPNCSSLYLCPCTEITRFILKNGHLITILTIHTNKQRQRQEEEISEQETIWYYMQRRPRHFLEEVAEDERGQGRRGNGRRGHGRCAGRRGGRRPLGRGGGRDQARRGGGGGGEDPELHRGGHLAAAPRGTLINGGGFASEAGCGREAAERGSACVKLVLADGEGIRFGGCYIQ